MKPNAALTRLRPDHLGRISECQRTVQPPLKRPG